MPIFEEIKQAAEALGKQLGADAGVQEYVRLKALVQQDADASEMETKLAQMYQYLVSRQQKGENLEQSEVDDYYALRRQVQEHPLLNMRDSQLEVVKALFAETAQKMTAILGIDYTKLAQ